MLKVTYVIVNEKTKRRARMILRGTTLYVTNVHEDSLFDDHEFASPKEALEAFNRMKTARFHPRDWWALESKSVTEAEAPPDDTLVRNYSAALAAKQAAERARSQATPPPTKIDIDRVYVHRNGSRLIINVDEVDDAELEEALGPATEDAKIYLYAQRSANKALEMLAQFPRPHLTHLIVDAFDNTPTRQGNAEVWFLSGVIEKAPNLKVLHALGEIGIDRPILHDNLMCLTVLGNPLGKEVLEHLAASTTPALTDLDLGLSCETPRRVEALDILPALFARHGQLEQIRIASDRTSFDPTDIVKAVNPLHLPPKIEFDMSIRDAAAFAKAVFAALEQGARLTEINLRLAKFADHSALDELHARIPIGGETDIYSPYSASAFLQVSN